MRKLELGKFPGDWLSFGYEVELLLRGASLSVMDARLLPAQPGWHWYRSFSSFCPFNFTFIGNAPAFSIRQQLPQFLSSWCGLCPLSLWLSH